MTFSGRRDGVDLSSFGQGKSVGMLEAKEACRSGMQIDGDLQCCPFESLPCQIGDFQFEFLLHRRIPMILDGIVRAPVEMPCYFSPFIAEVMVENEEAEIFVVGPGILVDCWIEMVVPPNQRTRTGHGDERSG